MPKSTNNTAKEVIKARHLSEVKTSHFNLFGGLRSTRPCHDLKGLGEYSEAADHAESNFTPSSR